MFNFLKNKNDKCGLISEKDYSKNIKPMSSKTLFVSKYCEHCGSLLENLKRNPTIYQDIQIVNIDSITVPTFLDRVPSLLIDNNKLLTDENLFTYFDEIIEKVSKSIEPFMIKEMGSSMSDNYSYLNDNTLNHSFAFIKSSSNVNDKIYKPKENDDIDKKVNFERYLSERENDIQELIKK